MKAAALLLVAVLAGCGVTTTAGGAISYPVGPSLAEFGLRERCAGRDQSCQDRAQVMLGGILAELGPPAVDPAMRAPDDPPPEGRLLIIFDAEPPFEWQTVDGVSGTAERVVIDLTGVVDGSQSYAVIGPGEAYAIDAGQAAALLDALFVRVD